MIVPTKCSAACGLDDRDRAFVTDLVYSTVRAERRLDDLIDRASSRPIKRLDAPVRAALRLGAYQLIDGVPAPSAVGETVKALVGTLAPSRGFANERACGKISRLGPPWPEPTRVAPG